MAATKIEDSRPHGLPSRNPLPLSASQEAQVRELYYKNVRDRCRDEIKGIKPLPFDVINPAYNLHRFCDVCNESNNLGDMGLPAAATVHERMHDPTRNTEYAG